MLNSAKVWLIVEIGRSWIHIRARFLYENIFGWVFYFIFYKAGLDIYIYTTFNKLNQESNINRGKYIYFITYAKIGSYRGINPKLLVTLKSHKDPRIHKTSAILQLRDVKQQYLYSSPSASHIKQLRHINLAFTSG